MLTAMDYDSVVKIFEATKPVGLGLIQIKMKSAISGIVEEARAEYKGVIWLNTHPIMVLYAHVLIQMAHNENVQISYGARDEDEDHIDEEGYQATLVNAHRYCLEQRDKLTNSVKLSKGEIRQRVEDLKGADDN
jgi:hypothetical protein